MAVRSPMTSEFGSGRTAASQFLKFWRGRTELERNLKDSRYPSPWQAPDEFGG